MAISIHLISAARKALLAVRVTVLVRCVLVCIMCITSALELAAGGIEGCRREEMEALVSLQRTLQPREYYYDTYYPPVPILAQWPAGGDGDCCKWQGVSCNADGRVEVLALNSGYELIQDPFVVSDSCPDSTPSLPPSLSSLQSLRVLELAGYCFSGGIPAPWRSGFRNLTHLDLSVNPYLNLISYSTTSPWYSSLPNTLTHLNLSHTELDAGLDLSQLLRHMPYLTHLHLQASSLAGPLIAPDHKALRDSLLRHLDLSHNGFSGRIPEGLGSLQRLAYLDLSWNRFSGRIPEGLGSLPRLAYLDLSLNAFQNPVPWQHLGNLSNLEHLSLGNDIHDGGETLLWDVIPSAGVGEGTGRGKQCNWLKLQSLECYNVSFRTSGAFCLDDPAITSRLTDLSLSATDTVGMTFLFHTLLPNASSLESLSLQDNMDWKLPLLPPLLTLKSLSISWNVQLTEFPGWLSQRPPPLIESLDVSNNKNLTGRIPLWVAELENLRFLNMEGNRLVGCIPPSLTNLSELLELNLGENNLVGQVPRFPKSLRFLELRSNLLTGPLPAGGLGSLRRLRFVDLSSNSFKGSLPNNMAENWTLSLVYFDLSRNNLTGRIPSSFSNARHLLHLDLSSNQLRGNIPPSLGNASQVQYLDLSNNQLTGCIPSSLGQIGQFQSRFLLGSVWLILSHNYLSCDFPASLAYLSYRALSFTKVDASNNRLTGWGSIPDHHDASNSSENNMYSLYLSYNTLRGELPSWMRNMSAAHIVLSHNCLSGSLAWVSLNNIGALDLSNNSFSGRLPTYRPTASDQLYSLQLDNNHLSGEIPASLVSFACENLTILTLSSNKLTGNIPAPAVQNCSWLMVLDLSNNTLSGEGTLAWMANNTFPRLLILKLSNNRLEGNIPSSLIHNLASVQILMLSKNHLSGTIPTNLDDLKAMTFPRSDKPTHSFRLTIPIKGKDRLLTYELPELTLLDFSENHLEGGIPFTIGALHGLQNLDLSHNELRGRIPNRMGKMAALEFLDLSNNLLEGKIPPELCSLSSLGVLHLASNHLEGPAIPASSCTQFTTFSESTFANNDGLCGPPLSKNCASSSNDLTLADHTSRPTDDNYQVLTEFQNVMSLEGFAIGYCTGFVLIIGLMYWRKHHKSS